MSQAITLNLPDNIFLPIARVAEATKQPVEELLLTALQASLPPLEGLPDDISENLSALETLDEQLLRRVMLETVPTEQAEQIHDLLEGQQLGSLDNSEQIRFRGKPFPTAADPHYLSGQFH